MTINELKTQYPALYSRVFNLGVSAERKRVLAAELIANSLASRNRSPVSFERSRSLLPVAAARHSFSQLIEALQGKRALHPL